jgi:probable phosphoglycerate mutase
MVAVQARAVAGLRKYFDAYADGELAVVSHADVIKSVLLHFLGAPLDLMRRIEIAPGSSSRVTIGLEDARVVAVNLPP